MAEFQIEREVVIDAPVAVVWRTITNHPAGDAPAAGNSALVEFTLVGEGERTRLRVIESGLELLAWPVGDKERFADEHRGGWAMFMDRLARLLAEPSRE